MKYIYYQVNTKIKYNTAEVERSEVGRKARAYDDHSCQKPTTPVERGKEGEVWEEGVAHKAARK
jgi:hypothetical protein